MSETKHVIWSNIDPNLDDWRDDLLEEYPDASEDELFRIMYQLIDDQLADERINLGGEKFDMIAIADLGRWNGRFSGYREYHNKPISDILSSECDYCEWYVDEAGELRSTQHHHDGTNYILYRKYRPNVSEGQKDLLKGLIYNGKDYEAAMRRYTTRLGPEVAKVYGWKIGRNNLTRTEDKTCRSEGR